MYEQHHQCKCLPQFYGEKKHTKPLVDIPTEVLETTPCTTNGKGSLCVGHMADQEGNRQHSEQKVERVAEQAGNTEQGAESRSAAQAEGEPSGTGERCKDNLSHTCHKSWSPLF